MLAATGIASRALTFILAGGRGERLYPLTRDRAKPAIPIGGAYRLIDFTLSNCFNSGVGRVTTLTQYKCESLHRHVAESASEDLFNIHCVCPMPGRRYNGTADAVFQNLRFLENTKPDFVLILSGDHVYRMDYRQLLHFHSDRQADVTIAGVECAHNAASQFGVLDADSDTRVLRFKEKPRRPEPMLAKPSRCLVSMGVYVFNTGTLIHALSDDAKRNTSHDFGKNIIPDLVSSNRVCVYNFTERGTRLGSYWRDVGTVDAYYRANMELLLNPSFDPYDDADWPLYSFEGGRPYYTDTDRGAVGPVRDSVISREVSLARGSHVLHSVLSPGVQIGRFAKVHDSILLHDVHVGVGARIQRAILDENVRIADGVAIGYDVERDREYGLVTDSGIVVIPANTHVGPSQTLSPPRANWRTELVKNDRTKSQQRDEISRTTQFDKE